MSGPLLCFEFPDAGGSPRPRCFRHPAGVITAHAPDEVRPALREAQSALESGLWVAGYVAYEAAPGLDPALKVRAGARMPLLWLGLFRGPSAGGLPERGGFHVGEWEPSMSPEEWATRVDSVREAIARGDTYQVNLTLRLRARFEGDDLAYYHRLRRAQRGGYCAYLDLGRYRVLSASPELFFRVEAGTITARPMKGTAPRGRWPEEDAERAQRLRSSPKERAENLMIVDLLRNDLGRIARVGSVRVPELFTLERYPTVHQTTSTITAELEAGTTLEEMFAALFPCGSVTGAPKVSTMGLIAELEDSPRGVYCGAVGFVAPGGEAIFSVLIRTVVVDRQEGVAEYGAGSAITWDSSAGTEYAEVLTKAAVLSEERPSFSLLETLRLEEGEYLLLERHLDRLLASAEYFGLPASREALCRALDRCVAEHPRGAWRVRLLCGEDAVPRVEAEPLLPLPEARLPVALAEESVSRWDRWLYHKTTHRDVYDRRRSLHPDVYDVLLENEEGELTELTTGNLVVELDGELCTPPRECGLLTGTFRAELLESGAVRERVLRREDLGHATRLWLVNSVRGWVPVYLAG